MARKRYYLDTSAYLAILLDEREGRKLEPQMRGCSLVSSVLLVLESSRNVIRLSREGRLGGDRLRDALERIAADVEHFQLRELTLDLCLGSVVPIVSTPRSLDLAHLRTALWFHRREPLDAFVSLDTSQLQAARELELPVLG